MKKTKKVISSVLLVMLAGMLMFVLSSCGDESSKAASMKEIPIHNGVTLGMSVTEVLDLESKNGVVMEKGTYSGEYHFPQKGTYYISKKAVTINGQNGTTLLYYFDDDGKLESCVYYYDEMVAYILHAWNKVSDDTLVSVLKDKYGTPSASQAADIIKVGKCVDASDCWNCQITNDGSSIKESKTNNAYQWIIPTAEGGIEVQFLSVSYSTPNGDTFTNKYASFSLLTQEEMSRVK